MFSFSVSDFAEAVGDFVSEVAGARGSLTRTQEWTPELGAAGKGVGWLMPTRRAAGHSLGISCSGGGGIGVCVHSAKALTTAKGVWYRSQGFLAIIFST